jgi:hypothetical protein
MSPGQFREATSIAGFGCGVSRPIFPAFDIMSLSKVRQGAKSAVTEAADRLGQQSPLDLMKPNPIDGDRAGQVASNAGPRYWLFLAKSSFAPFVNESEARSSARMLATPQRSPAGARRGGLRGFTRSGYGPRLLQASWEMDRPQCIG